MKIQLWQIFQNTVLTVLIMVINKYWDPIATHIGYPFNLKSHVNELFDVVERIREIQADLIRLDPYPFTERCKGWLRKVHELRTNAETIKAEQETCKSFNYIGKGRIGKKTYQEFKKATYLVIDGKDLLQEARSKPHLDRAVSVQHSWHDFYGMEPYKDKVLEFVNRRVLGKVQLLGIWGMGGVGKTTLLQIVRDSHVQLEIFDLVVFVHAGRGCTVEKLRKSILIALGLSPHAERDNSPVISNHFCDKNFVLLIDELWDHVILDDIGIPMGHVIFVWTGDSVREVHRKVIFTTRDYTLCGKMGCSKNIIHLECLSSTNAWNLFTDNVGDTIAEDSPIYPFAKKIVEECNGLPKALCMLGRAMSNKSKQWEWISALDLLMESKFSELNNMGEDLLKCLKLSYDVLPDQLKKCFLLCSLWPEDENIPRDTIVRWWIGAGFLDCPNPIHRGHHIISTFLATSLLENGDASLSTSETSHFRIHRMMRRMALWFVNDSGNCDQWLPHSLCRSDMHTDKWRMVQKVWISSANSQRFSSSVPCQQLTMLVTRERLSFKSISSFRELLFLDLEGTRMDEFPLQICSLSKLQCLNISGTSIAELPLELHRLLELKYLYMRDCAYLQTIAKGLISQLKKLLVLDLLCPGGARNMQYFASLMKELLGNTQHVIMFGINLQHRTEITKVVKLSSVCTFGVCLDHFEDESNLNTIDLRLVSPLKGLRELTVLKSSLCTELVVEGNLNYDIFQYLVFLELSCLPELKKVRWDNAGRNIHVVVIYNCHKIRHAIWVQNLPSLEDLTITYCPQMKCIVDNATFGFGSLKRLYLEKLPQLSDICEHGFPFEKLSYVCLDQCENLKAIKVEGRINQAKITIDCNTSWWTGLGQNQSLMNRHFVRGTCF